MKRRLRQTLKTAAIAATVGVMTLACAVTVNASGYDASVGAFAANGSTIHGGSANHGEGTAYGGSTGTIGDLAAMKNVKKQEPEYMEHAALVMFRAPKKVTKAKAGAVLSSGKKAVSDIEIDQVWSFRETPADEGTGASTGFSSLAAASGNAPAYSTVALVKSKSLTTRQLVAKMKARDDVIYAEPNYRIYARSVNDPYLGSQWSMRGGSAGTAQYSETTPNVTSVWDKGFTGTERIVAVVDTGVDYTHPDLADNMWHNTHYPQLKGEYGYDFNGGDDDPMDENGHGTHCAGIIGARGNNGLGISGVNQKVKIMALRILNSEGAAFMSHEMAAYNYIDKALDLGEPVQAINNSWGGGENSRIFAQLMDIVGKKGAISVCAAGNENNDNDAFADYPSAIESPYKISVSATREDGQLVGFSNYGKETVDTAAPGTDILSTVSYDSYNPTLYGADQGKLTEQFNDYESDAQTWGGIAALEENLYLNGEKYSAEEGKTRISMSKVKDGFLEGESGTSLCIEAKKMKSGDLVCFTIPYEIADNAVTGPSYSVMAKMESSSEEGVLVAASDVPQGTDLESPEELPLLAGSYAWKDDFDNWSHFSFQSLDEEELEDARQEVEDAEKEGKPLEINPLKREILIVFYAESGSDLKVCLDDMGLSRQDLESTEAFGQYDFMSGTSMAAPFISGAVALVAEEMGMPLAGADAEELTGEVIARAKTGSLPVITGGSFDFTKRPKTLPPRVGSIRVDKAGGQITITGTGLAPKTGLTVSIGPSKDELTEARILSQKDREIIVKDKGWINNLETVQIATADGRTVTKSDRYLVKGKKEYGMVTGVTDETAGQPLVSDGKYIYYADPSMGSILRMNTKKLSAGSMEIGNVQASALFGSEMNENASYSMDLGDALVYMNGKLYAVAEYGMADEKESEEDEFWFFGKKGQTVIFSEEEELGGSGYTIYSSDFRLISVDVKTGKVKNLGKLPQELKRTQDYALAAYNGKLFFMGGYDNAQKVISKKVFTYDPAKKKNKRWASGKALPQARAGGKALQSGKNLIYTLGYSEDMAIDARDEEAEYQMPANLVFNGKKWTQSSLDKARNIEPLISEKTVTRGTKTYPVNSCDIGAVKGGLIYMGMPVKNYGDTFLYKVSGDVYQDTGYNFIQNLFDDEIRGVAVGSRIYGFDGQNIYSAKAGASGFFTLKVKKNRGGKVTGQTVVPAGSNAKFTVKAKKGYVIKSIKAGSKKIKVKKNTRKKTFVVKKVLKNQTVRVVFKKKR